ncbi:hypothetical protein LY76DRAFT_411053 [Colletotrichum caudatum]|nr:hypothetical protein LY76DRAFT_411053 [Colletotrichum caudatum]
MHDRFVPRGLCPFGTSFVSISPMAATLSCGCTVPRNPGQILSRASNWVSRSGPSLMHTYAVGREEKKRQT